MTMALMSTPHTKNNSENSNSRPAFIRLPKAGQRCIYTGLTRSYLNFLTLASPANGYKPWVKSHVVRQDNSKTRGVRLIDFEDLLRHIRSQPSEIQDKLTGRNKCVPEAFAEGEVNEEEEGGAEMVVRK